MKPSLSSKKNVVNGLDQHPIKQLMMSNRFVYNSCMLLDFINRCVRAPLTYMADLRAISFKQYLLISTNFSPSYPIMIFTSLGFTLMYCAILIYFVFTSDFSDSCYAGVHGATYLITILYPIQSLLCFVCLTGSIALSKNNCWRVILMLLFGPILCGFGFGEVGIIQMCILSGNHEGFSSTAITAQPGFVDAMVYLYISFLALYFVLVPSIGYLYRRQNEDKAAAVAAKEKEINGDNGKQVEGGVVVGVEGQKKEQGSSCCSKTIVVLYYICNVFFVCAVIFIILIKIIGPILFTFIWVKMGAFINDFTQPMEKFLFAGLILAYFGPLGSMFITLAIQRLIKLGRNKKDGEGVQMNTSKDNQEIKENSVRRSTWQPNSELNESSRITQKRMEASVPVHEHPVAPEKSSLGQSAQGENLKPSLEENNEKKVGLL